MSAPKVFVNEVVRVLIVDDEPLARRRLRRFLDGRDGVEVAGEADNGRTAVTAIRTLSPDLVFLDIRMPDLDGFGVVHEIGTAAMPAVVFITAFDEYAIDAFEISALDYVLKPFTNKRLEQALERALERLREQRAGALRERLECLLDAQEQRLAKSSEKTPEKRLRRFSVRRGGRLFFVPFGDVDWIESDGPYIRLHTGERTHLVRDSLKRLEGALDPTEFARVHRSVMVRIDRVEELRPLDHGEYEVTLQSGVRLKLSRSYRDVLGRLMTG